MRRELAAVYDELIRLKTAGEHSVYLSDESMAFLEAEAQRPAAPDTRAEEPVSQPQPPAARTRAPIKPAIAVPPTPEFSLPDGNKQTRWDALRTIVMKDEWCLSQVKPGKQVVFGVGSLNARIFFCGEAPGQEEEILGEPFVGPAGQLLTKIIVAMGLERPDVYIGNIMNYRPPMPTPVGNRAPELNEMAYCIPYLKGQLDIVQPEVIVALGNTAVEGLLGHDPRRRIGRIRGQWMEFQGIPLIPTFHPSYLLRNETLSTKRLVWEDMLSVMDRLQMPVSDKQRAYFLPKGS